jgi:hypothetical protein
MKTRTKFILWSLPLLLIFLTYVCILIFSYGWNVPWKLVGKPSENISKIIGYNFSVGKLYIFSNSGEMYSLQYYHYNDPVPPPSDWIKDNSYKKELDPVYASSYEHIAFPSPPSLFKVKQIYQVEFLGVESTSVTKFALSEDGNLWYWRVSRSGLREFFYFLILVIEILAYVFAILVYFVILLTKRVIRKLKTSNTQSDSLLGD